MSRISLSPARKKEEPIDYSIGLIMIFSKIFVSLYFSLIILSCATPQSGLIWQMNAEERGFIDNQLPSILLPSRLYQLGADFEVSR